MVCGLASVITSTFFVLANYPDKKAILIFNDLESARVDHLKSEIENLQLTHVEVYYQRQDCNTFLRELDLDSYKNKYHTLLLYDPYNASIDWDAITPYLNRWGEVIINHMSSDTVRGISQAKKILIKLSFLTFKATHTSLLIMFRISLFIAEPMANCIV